MSLFGELKRRNVFRVGVAYVVAAWLLLQLTEVLSGLLELQADVGKIVIVLLLVGFPVALFFAWAFELTPEGIKREKDVDRSQSIAPQTGKKLNQAIIGLLVIALAYFVWESRFADRAPVSAPPESTSIARRADDLAEPATIEASSPAPGSRAGHHVAGGDEKSIAVLPFTHRSPDPDDIYFTDGVHDDLLTQLAKIGDLSVISRTSVLEYRDTTKNLRQIGEELGVANIMEGAVQRAGDRVRINVQLIDADSDEHLWAETYDRQLTTENLFEIQSEISRSIADALKATLTEEEIASVQRAPTDSVDAYELYLQARRFALGETLIGYNTAIDLYEKALELDPEFKLAWVGLAHAHITNYWSGGGDPADRERAWAVIEKARAIDPDFPELHLALGAYYYWGYLDYDTALEHLDRAVQLMPGSGDAHMWRGWALRRSGRWEAALEAMRESLRLDPRVTFNWVELGQTLFYLHRFEESREALERAREVNRDDFYVKNALANLALMASGDAERAMTLTLGAQHTEELAWFNGYVNTHILGREFEEALAALEQPPEGAEIQRQRISPVDLQRAEIHYFAGANARAREAAETGLHHLRQLAETYPGDYRLHLPRAGALALLDRAGGEVMAEIHSAIESSPEDAVEQFMLGRDCARTAAIAGLVEETIGLLEPLLEPPSATTVHIVDLDPAFDGIRDHANFVAMMERHR